MVEFDLANEHQCSTIGRYCYCNGQINSQIKKFVTTCNIILKIHEKYFRQDSCYQLNCLCFDHSHALTYTDLASKLPSIAFSCFTPVELYSVLSDQE